jgi:hypothetical protein
MAAEHLIRTLVLLSADTPARAYIREDTPSLM